MEEKKNNKGLVWLIISLIVIVLGLVIFIIFNSTKSDATSDKKDTTTNSTTTITTTTQKISDEDKNNKEKLISYGYKEIDIKNQEKIENKLEKDLSSLETNLEDLKNYYIKDEIESFTYDNGKVIYSFDNKISKKYQEIEDVKEIKYNFIDCEGELYIFIITNNGDIWYKYSIPHHTDVEKAPEFKKLKGKYKDVESLYLHSNTCGASIVYLAKDNNDNYYNIEDEIMFDKATFYITDDFKFKILNNRDVYYNNANTEVKFNFGLYEIVDYTMVYFISEDNYLYDLNSKKYSESKIESILFLQFHMQINLLY